MQKRCVSDNQSAYVGLVGSHSLWVGPSVFKKVLWVADYLLHPWRKLLNPLTHVWLRVILPCKCLQDALSGGSKAVNRDWIAIAEPKSYRSVKLASCSQFFVYENGSSWIVWQLLIFSVDWHSAAATILTILLLLFVAAMVGSPGLESLTTSHIERAFLTIRQELKRFQRKGLGYSKDLETHKLAVALHFGVYNFVRQHHSLGTTPAVAAGLDEKPWSLEQVVEMTEAYWL